MALFENFPYTNLHELNLDWVIKVIKEFFDTYPQAVEDIKNKISKPIENPNGYKGQFLQTLGDGSTQWADIDIDLLHDITIAVDEWLNDHPEATTTVQDGSIDIVKLTNSLKNKVDKGFVTFKTIASEARAACNAFIDENGICTLIDMSDENNGATVVNELSNISNLSAIIISHFDHDHIGNYRYIIENLPHENLVVYMYNKDPVADGDSWSDQNGVTFTTLVNYLETQHIPHINPSENQVITIGEMNFVFQNTNADYWYSTYTPSTLIYNNVCLCCTAIYGHNTVQFLGDMYPDGIDYLLNHCDLKNCKIMVANHHGLLFDFNRTFFERLNPEYVVCNIGTNAETYKAFMYSSGILNYCSQHSIPLLNTYENESFNLKLYFLGAIEMENIVAEYNNSYFIDYPSVRDILYEAVYTDTSTTMTIGTLLKLMPVNTTLTCSMNAAYEIPIDLDTTHNVKIVVSKYVGGFSNYLFNRNSPNDFRYSIDIVTLDDTISETTNIIGTYEHGNFIKKSVNRYMPIMIGTLRVWKADASDTVYNKYYYEGSKSINNTLVEHVNHEYFKVIKSGYYEISFEYYTTPTTDQITLGNDTWLLDNGHYVSRIVELTADTNYQFTSVNSSTATIYATFKYIGTKEFANVNIS